MCAISCMKYCIVNEFHRICTMYISYFYSKTNEMHQFHKFIVFCSSTLHVSDNLSVHHQEFKTVHTASQICQTDFVDHLLAGTRLPMMDGKTVRNMWSATTK
jgi:hypothetical protein